MVENKEFYTYKLFREKIFILYLTSVIAEVNIKLLS